MNDPVRMLDYFCEIKGEQYISTTAAHKHYGVQKSEITCQNTSILKSLQLMIVSWMLIVDCSASAGQ